MTDSELRVLLLALVIVAMLISFVIGAAYGRSITKEEPQKQDDINSIG